VPLYKVCVGHLYITGCKFECELKRDRGIKQLRSIQVQEQGAKTVTSLFILPALLGEVAVITIGIKEQDLSLSRNQVKV
jgi:hypothetical protein